MKTNKLTIICCTALSLFLSACSDWFDISPKTDVKAEDLFETETGFQSALAGIYIAMTNQNSYGANYTFGQLDKMVQYYDRTPGGQQVDPSVIFQYDEENQTYNSKQVLANMWSSSYNLIANANNLLSWLDKNGERVIRSEEERDMIRGEDSCISTCCACGGHSIVLTPRPFPSLIASLPMQAVSRCSRPIKSSETS